MRGIGTPITCAYHHSSDKIGFNVRAIFDQYCYELPVLHHILHLHFQWKFYQFTCLLLLEVDTVCIINYDYDKYISIFACGKSGGICDAKVKL